MDTYLARQPILSRNGKVDAYELLYFRDGSLDNCDYRAADAIVQYFTALNSSDFLDGKAAFLTLTPNLLMQNIPRIFGAEKLVIQIDNLVLIHPVARLLVQRYRKNGYRVALDGFEFNNRYFDMLPQADMIRVDFGQRGDARIDTTISVARKFDKQVIAFHVDTPEARGMAERYECDYIQGQSVAGAITSRVRQMDHLQSGFFRLMVAATDANADLDAIARLIAQDMTLTTSLLSVVNSAYFSLPSRVNDVAQALTILGLNQLRQWMYLLSFTPDGGAWDELMRTSFLRGVFCRAMVELAPEFPIPSSDAYLLGMFSTLEALLEVPLSDALRELPISREMKNGLITGEGKCGQLYRLCLSYERGDWRGMAGYARLLDIPVASIAPKYFECVHMVNETWKRLNSPAEDAEEA